MVFILTYSSGFSVTISKHLKEMNEDENMEDQKVFINFYDPLGSRHQDQFLKSIGWVLSFLQSRRISQAFDFQVVGIGLGIALGFKLILF